MYALYSKPRDAFIVNWPRNKTAEDITRYLAHMRDCPYNWDVKVDRNCGSISITLDTGLDSPAVAQWGKSINISASGHWNNCVEAGPGDEIAYVPRGHRVGVVLDTEDLGDLRYLADRGHTVTVRPDGVIVDRQHFSSYILRDEDGCISDLPYGHPRDYAIAEGLVCELVPEDEWR